MALRHPGHGTAHDRKIGAEKSAAARPQSIELGASGLDRRPAGRPAWLARVKRGLGAIGRGRSIRHPGVSSPYAVCRARSASSVYSAAIKTLTLISEVEITWMLMPLSASV